MNNTHREEFGSGEDDRLREAAFAAGCFWGVEQKFRDVDGVVKTEVGYSGGTAENPSYEQVCTGRTGHAETVHLMYDPNAVTYEELLTVFWNSHNPTTPNRQGPDVGSQYRSAIFYTSPEQKEKAEAAKRELQAELNRDVVTQIEPLEEFYRAEEYHQRYYEKQGL